MVNKEEDAYTSGAISLTGVAGEEGIKSIYHTPNNKTLRIGDDHFYLPTKIGPYESNAAIEHEKFTDYDVTTVTTLPTKILASGCGITGILIAGPLVLGTPIAGILVALGIIVGLATTGVAIKAFSRTSTAAAVSINMRHHTAEFVVEGNKDEIQQLDPLLEKLIVQTPNESTTPENNSQQQPDSNDTNSNLTEA